MRIGVVSDSHGNLYLLNKAIELLGEIDLLIHLGDHLVDAKKINGKFHYELACVAGNNDYSKPEDAEKLIEVGGKRIFLTHGHRYNVSLGLMQLDYKARELNADIVLFGHTHRFFLDENNGLLILNPGSVARPRDAHCSAAVLRIGEQGEVGASRVLIEY